MDQALQALLEQGQRNICICLLPGDHFLPAGLEFAFPVEESEFHLKIAGCGLGSRVFLDGPMRFTGVKAFTLRDVALELRFPAEGTKGAIGLNHCSEVTLTACHVVGFTAGDGAEAQGALLSITNADRIHVSASLATIPGRGHALSRTANSLLPQVDCVCVYLNGFKHIPAFLEASQIEIARNSHHSDLGDSGKFFWCGDNDNSYLLTCDDDIIYPPDYVSKLIGAIERYKRGVIVGFRLHNTLTRQPT